MIDFMSGVKKMSQMNNNTSKNLLDFATNFKKILVFQLIAMIVTVIGTFILASSVAFGDMSMETVEAILLIGIVILGLVTLIWQVKMLMCLAQAKLSSPHSELDKAFMVYMISVILTGTAMIVSIVDIFILLVQERDAKILTIISSSLTLCTYVCNIIAWKGLGNYIAIYATEVPPSNAFLMEAKGLNTYIITLYIVLITDTIMLILTNISLIPSGGGGIYLDPTDMIVSVISLVSGIAALVGYVAQFRIANGMLAIFGGVPTQAYPTQPPAPYTPAPTSGTDRFCIKCGAKLMEGEHFCKNCGHNLE